MTDLREMAHITAFHVLDPVQARIGVTQASLDAAYVAREIERREVMAMCPGLRFIDDVMVFPEEPPAVGLRLAFDRDPVRVGMQLGNAMWAAVNGTRGDLRR